jgi:hypothetical protein
MVNEDYETVDWNELESNAVAVVDGEYEVEAERYGTDQNGGMWLQNAGRWTRGPMDSDRVEIRE